MPSWTLAVATSLLAVAALPVVAEARHVASDDIRYVLPPDAIPAITAPAFDDGAWLEDEDRVVGVALDGVARAYPLRILNWHEIVDDRIGDVAFAVTYCPLCGTGIVFDRVLRDAEGDERTLTLKVSGRLFMSDLVMYDVETGSLWAQVWGEAIRGELHGATLDVLPSALTTWRAWREAHPDTVSLSRDTGHSRNYRADPYGGYDRNREIGITGSTRDDVYAMHPKEFVLGWLSPDGPLAFRYERLAQVRVLAHDAGDRSLVVAFHDDAAHLYEAGGRTFEPDGEDEGLMRDGDGHAWRITTGERVDGSASLQRVPAVPSFWFAWFDFHPDTRVWGALGVVETFPAHRAGNVDPAVTVLVRFTDALREEQAADPGSVVRLDPPVPGTWTWRDAATLAFTPDEPFAPGTYRIEVDRRAADRFGNDLGSFHGSLFTVGGPAPRDAFDAPSSGWFAGAAVVALGAAWGWLRGRRRRPSS